MLTLADRAPPQALGLVQAETPDNETKTEKAPQYYSAALNFWPWAFVRHAPAIPAHSHTPGTAHLAPLSRGAQEHHRE